jgi:hypothetical protein
MRPNESSSEVIWYIHLTLKWYTTLIQFQAKGVLVNLLAETGTELLMYRYRCGDHAL